MKNRKRVILFLAAAVSVVCCLFLISCRNDGEGTPSSASDGTGCAHQYVFSGFEWKKSGEVEAVYVCALDPSHTERRKVETTETVLREATPELAGQKRVTAREGGREETRDTTYMAPEVTLKVYSVNDFHGAVASGGGQTGLALFATYFKEKGEDPNTLLIDVGDTWQGSILSNFNTGKLICDAYNYVGFDAKVVGNHDFDWGPEILAENAARKSYGYQTPFLAANIYDYDFQHKKNGVTQQTQFGEKSVIRRMASGLSVGIVGVIGEEQITTINSLYTQDVCFLNHTDVIKKEARALREAGCDLVICAIHDSQNAVLGQELGDCVDLVLCAHSHQLESAREGDLLFAQFRSNGEYFGEITMKYEPATGRKTVAMKALSPTDVERETPFADLDILELIDRYERECRAEADVVVASSVRGSFSSPALPDLMCRAMYDACRKEGYEVCLTYCNKARTRLGAGVWTYEDLYEAFPFDDMIYIVDVTGRELLDEVRNYNFIYRSPDMPGEIDPDALYPIAVVDFLLFHTNTARNFNYFPKSASNIRGILKDNYRVVLRDWLISGGYADGETLSPSDFADSLPAHDRGGFSER